MMIGYLVEDEIERLLHTEALGRIGCHSEGKTYVVPVSYAYDGSRVICHSLAGQKVRMMRDNPSVCFEVEQVQDFANWRTVICSGHFSELQGSDAAAAMGLLVDRLLDVRRQMGARSSRNLTPHGLGIGESPVIYAIHLSDKTGRFEMSD